MRANISGRNPLHVSAENRRNAGIHPQGIVAELKSKNDRTAVLSSFYKGIIVVSKNQTGQ
jgi:hypothetical protein